MNFQKHPWRISYSSNENNPIAEFYIPALQSAIKYDRKSGFFNSKILSRVAQGIGAMLHSNGQIRLIMGCQFSPQDLQAIQQGYSLRDAMAFRLENDFKPPETFAQLHHFEILSWLIQNGYLDIKIAIPLKTTGQPEAPEIQLDYNHIFHEKTGIFTDNNGNQIAFSGSNNETEAGWQSNIESFHVYCSWEGERDLERISEEQYRFELLWTNLAPNVYTFDIPEAIQKKLLHYAPVSKPNWNRQIEFDNRPVSNQKPLITTNQPSETQPINSTISPENLEAEKQAFSPLFNLPKSPGCLDYCLKSIPIKPWPHQIKILRRVAEQYPCNFLIADEVGLGKTIETGLILRYLLVSQKAKRILILAPASVQPQWQEELREKFNLYFWSYSQNELKNSDGSSITPTGNPWNAQNLILASSHLVRRSERMRELIEAKPWDLIVLDEAHHARRQSPQNRKETPNRLLQLMQQIKERTRALILLSATPMQIDTIEVFDLLQILGLKSHWNYGDNFCNYFTSLTEKPDRYTLDFWQQMSIDYYQQGGKACQRLEQYLTKTDRLIAYRLRDTWQRGLKISNSKHCLADESFMTASRQYLTINTPIKDLMFRHTRDTLREYYRRGLLERGIPERKVQDNAITLEENREIPLYRAVSDYVRHFYKLAEKENRKALGFLMTLYRKRLTSSFYAIKESLQRRLDGINITPDDLGDLEDADDPIIEGLESYFERADPEEIGYLQDLLQQFEDTGEDSKFSHFISILRQELRDRESAIAFTQYTDTMDYLREALRQLYGPQVACYSGRGGEIYQNGEWRIVPKEQIKKQFRAGHIKILLCTESASEGLNLQTCGVLVNYDMPWNPMRVEQRIGRLDRIGQVYPTVRIHNFYYDGTVEAKVYRKLRDRIDAFQSVVGNLQPILAKVPTFIERAAMSADPEEEGVLLAEFDNVLEAPPLRPALDEMVTRDVEADLLEINRAIPSALICSENIEEVLTNSLAIKQIGVIFEKLESRIWQLSYQGKVYEVTFYPECFDERPVLQYMSWGNPLFERLMGELQKVLGVV